MDKMTIVFGVGIIFFALASIICGIRLIKINYKIKELALIDLLLDQTGLALYNADLIIDVNEKIILFERNHMDLDLSSLIDAVELNFKVIDSIQSNVRDLDKIIDKYQKGETE